MSINYYCLAVGILGLLSGCQRSSDVPPVGSGNKEWVRQDFENLWGWLGKDNAASLTQEKAHSGRFSMKTGPGLDYSLSFSAPLDQLTQTKPRKLHIQAWVWVPNERCKTTLVLAVGGPKGTTSWQGVNLSNKVSGYNSWQQLDTNVLMSPNITSEDALNVYLWQQDSNDNPVYLDDLVISEGE